MKVKCLKSVYVEDKKRGVMVARQIDEEFELDPSEEGETIYILLLSGKITIVDTKFIPENWRYIILRPFPYRTVEGFPRVGQPGAEISLSQERACELLVSGHVKPVDSDGWVPRNLLGLTVKDAEVRRMFDEPLPERKEDWVGDWRRRREAI